MALAELELDPHADVTTIPGISAEDAQTLAPVLGILGGSTQPLATSSSITQLLRPLTTVVHGPTAQDVLKGLSLLASGNLAEARTTLTHLESKRLPRFCRF